MTNQQQLPETLQPSHKALASLRKPMVPEHRETVKSSESAMVGESFWEFVFYMLLCAVLPWWAEDILDGTDGDDNGEKDYLILTPTAFIVSIAGFIFSPAVNGWRVFTFAMMITVLTFLGLILFQIIFHKCITMYTYNHVFRRSWMHEMHMKDDKAFAADTESYPQRLEDYESDYKTAWGDATIALNDYNANNPDVPYELTEYGFQKVSLIDQGINYAGKKIKGLFNGLLNRATS